jgi:steroid 5-alpha reductase family enzyme
MASTDSSRKEESRSDLSSLGGVLAAVVVGLLVAWAGSAGAKTAGGIGIHWWVALAAFAINWAAFVPSFIKRTEHYYDLVGSATYLGTTILAVGLARPDGARGWILALLIAIWALRLGTFLFRRVKKAGKDGRFDRIKQSAPRFLVAWTLQGLWVIFTAAAAHAAIATDNPKDFGFVGLLGLLIWIGGFAIEAVADRQKSAFKADPANDGLFISEGLWAWSRHPNYFGEIVLWIGIAVIAAPVLSGWQYVTLLSPVFVILLLTRISGLPALERRADKRWGGQDDYERYKAETPVLVPRPPR